MRHHADAFNDRAAFEHVQRIADPVVRNLVGLGLAKARMAFVRVVGQTPAEWRPTLPGADFDLLFYVRLLESMCSETDIIRGVLDGKTLAEASGWDV